MSILETIRAAMKPRSMSQKELARELWISESYLSDILIGRRDISVYVAIRLEAELGLNAEALLIRQVKEDLAAARGDA